ncbi:hypothetical protein KC19_1G268100 [Ceratodon purpureus]|uniref:Secreted protein n=1 Tax=Ceratodon purpureus TaxID=3225 RepID=A0A8T0JAV1_CERPU|nr:hypothetical protein KC19_1G268100 [Ceratodon purpureus]
MLLVHITHLLLVSTPPCNMACYNHASKKHFAICLPKRLDTNQGNAEDLKLLCKRQVTAWF